MASKWSAKENVCTAADAGAPTVTCPFLKMDSSVTWTNQPFISIQNNNALQAVISPYGGLYRVPSQGALDLWGGYTDQDAVVALSRADIAGEPDAQDILLAATSDDWTYAGQVFIDANAASTGAAGSYNAQTQLQANNATNTVEIQSKIGT